MTKEISRRKFLQLVAGTGTAGLGAVVAGCKGEPSGGKGWVPDQYNGRGTTPVQLKGRIAIAEDNPSLVRDDEKCVLCGQCLEACENVMSVFGHYPLPLKQEVACVHCGRCIMCCPSGAISERRNIKDVLAAIKDKTKHVVVQTAPATKVALSEEFGVNEGSGMGGKIAGALKAAGFDAVFDTCFTADLTIMEEATEFIHRLTKKQDEIPHITSCCPGWVKFCEYFYPEFMHNLSTCKSPQNMLGAMIKSYYASKKGINPDTIVNVSVMPCTAKKFEASREELAVDGNQDIDYVLTTRELAILLKQQGIDMLKVKESSYDSLLGESTGAGRIFGATGGVTEAAVRSAYFFATGQQPPAALLQWQPVRGMQAVKEAVAEVPGVGVVNIAVCHGLSNVRAFLDGIKKAGSSKWQFIEIMACPGGCIGGGGQPRTNNDAATKAQRMTSIYKEDTTAALRCSHDNSEIKKIYQEYLGKPLSERAEKYLHTHYVSRHSRLFD